MLAGRLARPPYRRREESSRGRMRVWKCVKDPSEGTPFKGNLFRWEDLKAGGFGEGAIFENIRTGEMFVSTEGF